MQMHTHFPLHKMLQAYIACCRPVCQEMKLPQTAFDILMFLANNPEYNTARDIVKIRGIKANLVSINVDKLVNEGYIERKSVPGDRRKTCLTCTEKAMPLIKQGRTIQALFFQELFKTIDPETLKIFQQVIHAVEKNLDRMIEQPLSFKKEQQNINFHKPEIEHTKSNA